MGGRLRRRRVPGRPAARPRAPPPHPTGSTSGDRSFADDLNKERGIVSCRVALSSRSSEIQPLFSDLFGFGHFFFFIFAKCDILLASPRGTWKNFFFQSARPTYSSRRRGALGHFVGQGRPTYSSRRRGALGHFVGQGRPTYSSRRRGALGNFFPSASPRGGLFFFYFFVFVQVRTHPHAPRRGKVRLGRSMGHSTLRGVCGTLREEYVALHSARSM